MLGVRPELVVDRAGAGSTKEELGEKPASAVTKHIPVAKQFAMEVDLPEEWSLLSVRRREHDQAREACRKQPHYHPERRPKQKSVQDARD